MTNRSSPDPSSLDPDRLVGVADLRRLWKVSRATAHARTLKDDAPEPVEEIANGAIWRLGDWIDYEATSPNAANWKAGERIVRPVTI